MVQHKNANNLKNLLTLVATINESYFCLDKFVN